MLCTTKIASAKIVSLKGPLIKKKKKQPSSSFNRLKGGNPLDSKDNITRCTICESINQWGQDCPRIGSQTNGTWLLFEVVLFQADFDNPDDLKGLLTNSWNATVLDSG